MKLLPRKEYRTITVKVETFQRFLKEKHKVRIKDRTINNSTFLDSLLTYKKTG